MADNTESKLSFKTADELTSFLMDLQGQIANLTETVDKLAPVEPEAEEPASDDQPEEETLSDEDVSEIDKLLQSE